MEYSLLKTIENSVGILPIPNERFPRLTAFPANECVNPGLGQIARLHAFYVPLYSNPNLHEIQKKNLLENLEGSGTEKESAESPTDISSDIEEKDPLEYNLEKRKRMGSPIQESFLHPKLIKIDKITLKKKPKSEIKSPPKPVSSKVINHKFKFFD